MVCAYLAHAHTSTQIHTPIYTCTFKPLIILIYNNWLYIEASSQCVCVCVCVCVRVCVCACVRACVCVHIVLTLLCLTSHHFCHHALSVQVFGNDVTDASIDGNILIVVHGGRSFWFYSLKALINMVQHSVFCTFQVVLQGLKELSTLTLTHALMLSYPHTHTLTLTLTLTPCM